MAILACSVMVGAAGGCTSESSPSTGAADADRLIDVAGAIGGIHPGDTRARAEQLVGPGKTISTSTRHQKVGGDYTLTRVFYPASQLAIVYVTSKNRSAEVFGVLTTNPRYHTADGLHVGSTLAQARHEPGVQCSAQPGYYACQGGLGYEKPVTSFTVRSGRVVRVFMAAVAD
jgi:hypothetical protein